MHNLKHFIQELLYFDCLSYETKVPSFTSFMNFSRYRLQTVKSLAGVSLMLRLLWACLRWDDMAAKPPPGGGTTRTGSLFKRTFNFVNLQIHWW